MVKNLLVIISTSSITFHLNENNLWGKYMKSVTLMWLKSRAECDKYDFVQILLICQYIILWNKWVIFDRQLYYSYTIFQLNP